MSEIETKIENRKIATFRYSIAFLLVVAGALASISIQFVNVDAPNPRVDINSRDEMLVAIKKIENKINDITKDQKYVTSKLLDVGKIMEVVSEKIEYIDSTQIKNEANVNPSHSVDFAECELGSLVVRSDAKISDDKVFINGVVVGSTGSKTIEVCAGGVSVQVQHENGMVIDLSTNIEAGDKQTLNAYFFKTIN